jgi:hypothetical protein
MQSTNDNKIVYNARINRITLTRVYAAREKCKMGTHENENIMPLLLGTFGIEGRKVQSGNILQDLIFSHGYKS